MGQCEKFSLRSGISKERIHILTQKKGGLDKGWKHEIQYLFATAVSRFLTKFIMGTRTRTASLFFINFSTWLGFYWNWNKLEQLFVLEMFG